MHARVGGRVAARGDHQGSTACRRRRRGPSGSADAPDRRRRHCAARGDGRSHVRVAGQRCPPRRCAVRLRAPRRDGADARPARRACHLEKRPGARHGAVVCHRERHPRSSRTARTGGRSVRGTPKATRAPTRHRRASTPASPTRLARVVDPGPGHPDERRRGFFARPEGRHASVGARSCAPGRMRRPVSSTSCRSTAHASRTVRRSRIPTSSTTRRPTSRHALRAGESNAFAFVTHWSTPGQGRPASEPAFIARITIDHADGTREVVVTDATWRAHAGPWIQGPPRNDEGDFVEHVDGRLEPDRVGAAGFDDRSWTPAAVIGAPPVAPFTHLFPARTHIVEHALSTGVGSTRHTGRVRRRLRSSDRRRRPSSSSPAGAPGRRVTIVGGDLLDPDGHVSQRLGAIRQTDMHWDYDERDGGQTVSPVRLPRLPVPRDRRRRRGRSLRPIVRFDARHASMPDERAATLPHVEPDDRRGVEPRAPLRALLEPGAVRRHTDAREGPVPRRRVRTCRLATMAAFGERSADVPGAARLRPFAARATGPTAASTPCTRTATASVTSPTATERYVEWVWQAYDDHRGSRHCSPSLYPRRRDRRLRRPTRSTRRPGSSPICPAAAATTYTASSTGRRTMRYGYDMADRGTHDGEHARRSRCSTTPRLRPTQSLAHTRRSRRSSARAAALTTAIRHAARARRRTVRRRARSRRHAEHARIATRERVRVGIRHRAERRSAPSWRATSRRRVPRWVRRPPTSCSTRCTPRATTTRSLTALTDPHRPG